MPRFIRYIYLFFVIFFLDLTQGIAQQKDTVICNLKNVEVVSHFSDVLSTAPSQTINSSDLDQFNALQVSDAVKHFAGVDVKDYGGVGGLKTVSVRSLGSEHTVVSLDGIAVSDCQTGQIDIGRYSLENVDMLSLVNGQSDNIFQPAKLFSAGAVLNIQTKSPSFENGETQHLKITSKFGSFGLFNPSVLWDKKINKKLSVSFNSEWMQTNGNYPFILSYGQKNDSTSKEIRKNSDVKKIRTEATLYGHFSDKDEWQLKSYYYQSEQGLPGAVIYYNPTSDQRMWDKNFFTQSRYKTELSPDFSFLANAKYNYSFFRYLDPDYLNAAGKEENNYYQHEYYLSSSLLYKASRQLSFALSSDGIYNDMDADLYDFAYPKRYSWLSDIAAKYVTESVLFTSSLLYTHIDEAVLAGLSASDYRKISPFASLSFKPFSEEDFRLRFFYKNIFRLPSFNDLYYSNVGNTNLLPENTNQYNLGFTYLKNINSLISYVSFTADAYYNQVTDKIIAIPTKNIFIWSMMNLGKVQIEGIDLTMETSVATSLKTALVLQANYTYQEALDVTDPTGKTYNNQIPYTPQNSGSGRVAFETPSVDVACSILLSGMRYYLGQNIPENRLDGYCDIGLSAKKKIKYKKSLFTINGELLNLLNKNYEIVKNYPMPGLSFRLTLSYSF
jgi:outer membrane cobalamin receptor